MLRRKLTKWTVAAAVAFAAVAIDAKTSQAFGHRWGSWGSSGGSWGSSGGSWGSSGGSWGGHRHWRGSWGSSGGSWGSSGGSSGGWSTYYGSSGGSWGSSGGSSGGYYYHGAPAYEMQDTPPAPQRPTEGTSNGSDVPPPSPMPGAVYRRLGGGQVALLNVNVPAEARIFVNGNATTSTGMQRQFISRGLDAGNRYAYEVRAEIERDGQTISQSKSVALSAGQQVNVAFDFDKADQTPVAKENKAKTKLTLRVPADAKVTLGGNDTRSTGEVREFTTSKLAPGQAWDNYTIRVVTNVDGREVSKEETITLVGGEDRQLTIGVDGSEIAQTASVTR